jgi:hypothetical protein
MPRFSERAKTIMMLAASAVLFAQGDTVQVKAQNRSSVTDVRQIME